MSPRASIATRIPPPETAAAYSTSRVRLGSDAATTLHEARFDRRIVDAGIVAVDPPASLLEWCRAGDLADALVGGFFVRPQGTPLGELRIGGRPREHVPFEAPWDRSRACVGIQDGRVEVAAREAFGNAPDGDLLQAGPLLLSQGRSLVGAGHDPEGFSAGAGQFDSDITAGRYPRAALGCNDDELIAAVCDGRAEHDQGLTLEEMADLMIDLGATDAINLDGGGSASLVLGGVLRNRPREEHGIDLVGGRPISTALVFSPRPVR